MDKSALLELRPLLEVAHHLPGRLRLRLRPGRAMRTILDSTPALETSDLSSQLPGLLAVERNTFTGSILIHYDPEVLPFSQVDHFFRTDSASRATEILHQLFSTLHQTGGTNEPRN
jgi:hypothetical protein